MFAIFILGLLGKNMFKSVSQYQVWRNKYVTALSLYPVDLRPYQHFNTW